MGLLGAVLNVIRGDEVLPVAFWSRQLRGAEVNFSITELESLAIVASVEYFLGYLYGRSFTVVTDYKPCVSLLSSTHLNRRLRSMALKLQEFNVKIVYRQGKENGNADALSRQLW